MEDFKANWEELKLRYKEEGSKRERIVKVFYDYYFPILEKKGTVLIKKYKAPEIDGISITNDILIDFIKKFEIKITKNNFQSADDLERYLIKILHNRIKRLLKRKRFIEVGV
jgi:hypothetical protein